jgi:hypothetical protein
MTTAEKLARHILRVGRMRERYAKAWRAAGQDGEGRMMVVDSLLERACKAIGSADDVAMTAACLSLEAITE